MVDQVRALRLVGRALVSPISQARSVRRGVFPKRHNSTVTGVSAVLQASETGTRLLNVNFVDNNIESVY